MASAGSQYAADPRDAAAVACPRISPKPRLETALVAVDRDEEEGTAWPFATGMVSASAKHVTLEEAGAVSLTIRNELCGREAQQNWIQTVNGA
jgi:hypothetical protein